MANPGLKLITDMPVRVAFCFLIPLVVWGTFAERAAAQTAQLPRVLLIGDSISLDYTAPVRCLLQGKAHVLHAVDLAGHEVNCGSTLEGLRGIEEWLGSSTWNVIHFNWGLWDLCYRHPESKLYGHRDKVRGKISIPLPQYRENLEVLVRRLEKTGARLIWASTTVIPEGEAGRFAGDEIKYNRAAQDVMAKHGIAIDDLYTLTHGFAPELFVAPGDVHYTEKGSSLVANQVAREIEAVLRRRAGSPLVF